MRGLREKLYDFTSNPAYITFAFVLSFGI